MGQTFTCNLCLLLPDRVKCFLRGRQNKNITCLNLNSQEVMLFQMKCKILKIKSINLCTGPFILRVSILRFSETRVTILRIVCKLYLQVQILQLYLKFIYSEKAKILRNLQRRFVLCKQCQSNQQWDIPKFCCHLRMYELYKLELHKVQCKSYAIQKN